MTFSAERGWFPDVNVWIRLLTNPKVMADDSLSPPEAIAVYLQLAGDDRVRFEPEAAVLGQMHIWQPLQSDGSFV